MCPEPLAIAGVQADQADRAEVHVDPLAVRAGRAGGVLVGPGDLGQVSGRETGFPECRAGERVEGASAALDVMVTAACGRAKANGRKTVRKTDL